MQSQATGRQSPEFEASNIHYEIVEWQEPIACGGIGLMQQVVKRLQIDQQIDRGAVLYPVNRYGKRPSREGDAAYSDCSIEFDARSLEQAAKSRKTEMVADGVPNDSAGDDPLHAADHSQRSQVDQLVMVLEPVVGNILPIVVAFSTSAAMLTRKN